MSVGKTVGPGDTIWLDGKNSLTLGKLIKSGGAGSVYLLPRPRRWPSCTIRISTGQPTGASWAPCWS